MEWDPFGRRLVAYCWYGPKHPNLNRRSIACGSRVGANEGTCFLCLPSAYLASFTKSGTTVTHFNLQKHPNIVDRSLKEYHFWYVDRLLCSVGSGGISNLPSSYPCFGSTVCVVLVSGTWG